jgi:transposase
MSTAKATFTGPEIIFGAITNRFGLDRILQKAFGDIASRDILSLAWYLVSEGAALSDSDAWLNYYANPRGCAISSQDITRLLDRMDMDSIMTFYKEWLGKQEKNNDKVLYDLTSISWSGKGIDWAQWGHNRDNESLPQVNFALLCTRSTAMPLFAWPLPGSISDTRTLQNTLQFLENLGYKPNCLMMDRGFSSQENISFMLQHGHTFLQALRLNSGWIQKIIDASRLERLSPDSMLVIKDRTYYVSTTKCQWNILKKKTRKGDVEQVVVQIANNEKSKKYVPEERGYELVSQHKCFGHVLFCQDLVGKSWDKFMASLKNERDRLRSNETAVVQPGLAQYFDIKKDKYSRHRSVEFNIENIEKHRDRYSGHICFMTNDETIATAEDALKEYSTRDYIEKDFDELKNDLDMKRIRVHTNGRLCARLLIQLVAEIILREIRVKLRDSDECKKLTRRQISAHIRTIYKISFNSKHKDVRPELTKCQRELLIALGISDNR